MTNFIELESFTEKGGIVTINTDRIIMVDAAEWEGTLITLTGDRAITVKEGYTYVSQELCSNKNFIELTPSNEKGGLVTINKDHFLLLEEDRWNGTLITLTSDKTINVVEGYAYVCKI